MNKVYFLQHSYEIDYQGASIERTKTIGIYSTKEKAEEVVQRYKDIEGFNKHPITCFYIYEYDLDKDNWTEGFVGTDEIEADFEILTSCFNEWLDIKKTPEESWEDDNYYNALCEVNEKVYKVKDTMELAVHISAVWDARFNDTSKTPENCINVATKVLSSLKLK